ncbi:hypothetical protein C8R44DRAFT_745405 [Mycena epipterygia]|nr:hypothetical protein C8R44DRAFT_745405 [Mycena epipterygia]
MSVTQENAVVQSGSAVASSHISTPNLTSASPCESLGVVSASSSRPNLSDSIATRQSTPTRSIPAAIVSSTQSTQSTNGIGKHAPITTTMDLVIAALLFLLICLTALLIRRRHASRQNNDSRHSAPYPVWPELLRPANENGVNIRSYSRMKKGIHRQMEQPDNTSSQIAQNGSSSSLPTPAELALANMAVEIRLLRGQFQRLEVERHLSGIEAVEEQPPEYATG